MNIKDQEKKLIKSDPVLGEIIKVQKLPKRELKTDYFKSLSGSIVSQQVSVFAARAIYTRLENVTDLDYDKIINLSDKEIKEIGLSKQKVKYITDLALHFKNNPDVFSHLNDLSDEEVIDELTKVKGIGIWTAQMFLITSLGRPDVFAMDDGGLQRAISLIYKCKTPIKKSKLEKISNKWRPYRTIASLHLWKYLDNEG